MPKSADLPWPAPLCESVKESVYQQHMIESPDEPEKVSVNAFSSQSVVWTSDKSLYTLLGLV